MGSLAGREGGSKWTGDNNNNDNDPKPDNTDAYLDNGFEDEDDDDGEEKKSAAQKLLEIVEPFVIKVFQDQLNFPYAAVTVDDHREIIEIPVTHNNTGRFKRWMGKTHFDQTGKILSNVNAISAVFNHLASKADFDGNRENLDLRVSYGNSNTGKNKDKTIYYDLANK